MELDFIEPFTWRNWQNEQSNSYITNFTRCLKGKADLNLKKSGTNKYRYSNKAWEYWDISWWLAYKRYFRNFWIIVVLRFLKLHSNFDMSLVLAYCTQNIKKNQAPNSHLCWVPFFESPHFYKNSPPFFAIFWRTRVPPK